jgi:hypothetical protein
MRKANVCLMVTGSVCLLLAASVAAHAPSGAIFTTLPNGSEVNFNIYETKEDVYLDGGPGIGAPQTAAGLDEGIYVFQVTDPSGRVLLSTDEARCRQFAVDESGIIIGVVAAGGCEHLTGVDIDHGATTVQLMPFENTPNPGGEYKAWVVEVGDFLDGCAAIGVENGLEVVDCGRTGGNLHGFVPAHTKTDNFKIRETRKHSPEIDTWFIDDVTGDTLPGLSVRWIDTLGAGNKKWSYLPQSPGGWFQDNIAHVEAVEKGTHYILVSDQPGCRVLEIYATSDKKPQHLYGPGLISVSVRQDDPDWTKEILVLCDTNP